MEFISILAILEIGVGWRPVYRNFRNLLIDLDSRQLTSLAFFLSPLLSPLYCRNYAFYLVAIQSKTCPRFVTILSCLIKRTRAFNGAGLANNSNILFIPGEYLCIACTSRTIKPIFFMPGVLVELGHRRHGCP